MMKEEKLNNSIEENNPNIDETVLDDNIAGVHELLVNELNKEAAIYFEKKEEYYFVHHLQYDQISEGGSNIWKDVSLASIGVFLSLVANALATKPDSFTKVEPTFFFNFLFASVSFMMLVISSVLWYKSDNKMKNVLKDIKAQKPIKGQKQVPK